jgi:Ca-activated chloride channel homolog
MRAIIAFLFLSTVMAQELMPPPLMKLPPDNLPAEIVSAKYALSVRGLFAKTTATIVFRNPNGRQLSADFALPLPDGATVCGYALDIGGRMVDGVVVGKDQGRMILESEQRQRVDPGLVEHVRGNLFQTRIFPLPAMGTRTIRVEWTSELLLSGDQAAARVALPRCAIPSLELAVDLAAGGKDPVVSGFGNLTMSRWHDSHVGHATLTDVTPNDDLVINLPAIPERVLTIERRDSERFIAIAVRPPDIAAAALPAPRRLAVAWDASGSRSQDGIKRGRDALVALAARWPQTAFDLVVFRDQPEAAVPCADATALAAALDRVTYDGGTDLSQLDLRRAALPHRDDARWLLVSDGVGTIGGTMPACDDIPVDAIAVELVRDSAMLRVIAQRSGGQVVDGMSFPAAEIATRIAAPMPRLLRVDAADGVLADVQIGHCRDRGLVLARLLADGVVDLVYGTDGATGKTVRVPVRSADAIDGDIVAKAWAGARAEDLAVFPSENRAEILALGRRYGVVTPGTSLIVLERLDQYLRHRVEPPASWPELREQYADSLKQWVQRDGDLRQAHVERLVGWWNQRVAWWDGRGGDLVAKDERDVPASAPAMFGSRARRLSPLSPTTVGEDSESAQGREEALADVEMGGVGLSRAVASAAPGKHDDTKRNGGTIAIAAFEPDTPYLRALTASAPAERYATYLRERMTRTASPSFYLDCASYFLAQERALGKRILSNLAELKLEDPSLLRMYAWRLSQAGDHDSAIAILRKILRLRPEEPQSYRDLALALAQRSETSNSAADIEEAMDLLARFALRRPLTQEFLGEPSVLQQAWDRFPCIEVIALEELNCLIARALRGGFDRMPTIPDLDARLRRNLETDVRVVMNWDQDATDIDLHVREPGGEEAYYGHRYTQAGGLVSNDCTQGYGPEEYLVRRAPDGEYEVRCRYYGSRSMSLLGPATVVATVFTNWGRPSQRSQVMTLRLEKPGDSLRVGTVRFSMSDDAVDKGGQVTGRARSRAEISALKVGLSRDEVEAQLGAPERVDGGGMTVYVYRLDDGSAARIAFAPKLLWARQVVEGAERDLVRQ